MFGYLETALEIACKAVAKEYEFVALVMAGKSEHVKRLAASALHKDVLDHACVIFAFLGYFSVSYLHL